MPLIGLIAVWLCVASLAYTRPDQATAEQQGFWGFAGSSDQVHDGRDGEKTLMITKRSAQITLVVLWVLPSAATTLAQRFFPTFF